MRLCTVEGCDRKHHGTGLCKGHYQYLWETGKWPTHRLMTDIPFEERFWARTTPGENGCIIWTGGTMGNEYGECWWDGRSRPAHIVAYLAFVGDYDRSLELDHLCKTPACVNPLHLEPVTPRQNKLRSNSPWAINARKTHCKHGHPFDEENTFINTRGTRECRACRRAIDRRYYERQKLLKAVS